jgi:hypothetical protein
MTLMNLTSELLCDNTFPEIVNLKKASGPFDHKAFVRKLATLAEADSACHSKFNDETLKDLIEHFLKHKTRAVPKHLTTKFYDIGESTNASLKVGYLKLDVP